MTAAQLQKSGAGGRCAGITLSYTDVVRSTAGQGTAVRGRFAPSPTGRFHLGNARTSLLTWLDVRAAGGTLVMRVEDVDPGRSRAEHERNQLDDLRWLGLDWDEGPDVGGPRGPYRQSERGELYASMLDRLETYRCTCTRREVRAATLAPHGREPVYPGTCRHGPTHPDRPAAIRWRAPPGSVNVDDTVYGRMQQQIETDVGDVVLRRADGAWAYQLAVVTDDALMDITHVMRGADLLESTPRQVHLQRALGLPTPVYAHVPVVLGPDGEKLSKRHGAPDLGQLRASGADPLRVVAVLAASAGLTGGRAQRVHPRELLADYDASRISASPGDVLDIAAVRATVGLSGTRAPDK